jgi:glycosyltransferase involved in cell wall biosynthesis
MKVLIVHGYFLSGTGSNLFVNMLAKQFAKENHHVHVMCQEKINYYEKHDNVCIKKPDIKGVLPVYVYDKYPGYDSVLMCKASNDIISRYINLNATFLDNLLSENDYDLIISNHLVLQPQYVNIALRKHYKNNIKHLNVVHGSDLHFAISKNKNIFKLGLDALLENETTICVSHSSAQELRGIYSEELDAYSDNIRILNSGVDTTNFSPILEKKSSILSRLVVEFETENSFSPDIIDQIARNVMEDKIIIDNFHDSFSLKQNELLASQNLSNRLSDSKYVITFVGKYLETKGIFQLLLSLPLLKIPNIEFVAVGFGNFRVEIEYLLQIFRSKNIILLKKIFKNPEKINLHLTQTKIHLTALAKYLDDNQAWEEYLILAEEIYHKITFVGYLNTTEVSKILQLTDQFVAPSVFSEAFGMVGIEALAAGCKTSVSYQTGFKDMVDDISKTIQLDFKLGIIFNDEFILNIIEVIKYNYNISLDYNKSLQIHKLIDHNYSWETLANKFLTIAKD